MLHLCFLKDTEGEERLFLFISSYGAPSPEPHYLNFPLWRGSLVSTCLLVLNTLFVLRGVSVVSVVRRCLVFIGKMKPVASQG